MAWEDCVAYIRTIYQNLEEAENVTWSTVSQNALDNDTFSVGTPFYLVCPDRHCTDYVDQSPAAHQYCNCRDINGNSIPGCTPKIALEPISAKVCINIKTGENNSKLSRACTNQGADWYQLSCFCCCSCFANGTKIAVPDPAGFKKIEDIQVANKVCTAKILVMGNKLNLFWGASTVSFSQGTGPDGHQSNMISITFDNPEIKDGSYKSIIVTPDHLFLLSTGTLKRADQLAPGIHFLVNKEGNGVSIHEVACGEYAGGVHHIATVPGFSGDMDEHLILAEGVVTGDFTLQINAGNIKEYMSEDHYSAPKVGTKEYIDTYKNLKKVNYAKFQIPDFKNKKVKELNANFFVYGEHSALIPSTAASYLSKEQEQDVDSKLDLIHFTELAPKSSIIQYLIRLYKGFFPDINIYFDSGMTGANAYAFVNQYKEKTIIISGGLGRIKDLNLEGYAVIIAHMISCVQKSAPVNRNGYTTVGMADYYSMQILSTVFYLRSYNEIVNKGISQITKSLFDNISDKDKDYKGDPYQPSIDTRLDALDAGNAMSFPPPGIGGPEFRGLELLNAISKPPVFSEGSFITDDIDAAMSQTTFASLLEHKVLLQGGVLSTDFNIHTDLSFLFNEKDSAEEVLLTEEVRYILLHPVSEVTVSFNMDMRADRISALDDFEFQPAVNVKKAVLDNNAPKKLHLSVSGLKRNTDYVLTGSSQLISANGSTMNPDKNSIQFHS